MTTNNDKKEAAKKKKATKKTAQKRVPYYAKPERMTLEEWQIALRRQAAQDEKFVCRPVDDVQLPGEYTVQNPKTGQAYKVVYRGARSPWNYCSCMDFKASQLGTCKHLEGLKLWLGSHRHFRVHRDIPPYTSVYLSYTAGRQVRIRIGSEHREEYEALAARYFDRQGVMTEEGFIHYADLMVEGRRIDASFRFYDDAISYIVEQRERRLREQTLAGYSDHDLDALLSVGLYPYQREGVRFAFATGKSIIADEMGLGKTIQAIATAELLRKERLVSSVLVVCPTSLKYQWKREIERFARAEAHVIEGMHLRRKKQYNLDVPYKIISYNSVCNDIKVLGSLETDLLIMDEVQRLKNWNTQISIAARRINSTYSVILSGTPLENKLEELFSVMEFADQYCLGPFYRFKDECIVTDEATGKVLGYQNLNRVGELVRQRLIRRTKKGVALQMPERQDKNLIVPMTKEQMALHEEFDYHVFLLVQKWNRMHFLSEADRLRLLKLLSQMRMVCDSTYILDQKTRNDTKVDETMSILQNLFEQGEQEKVVIFSQWERMTRLIAQELQKRQIGYAYLHGGVPSRQRSTLISDFCDNPQCRVFLSTDAGSTGLNLQVASTLINLDLPWNPAVLEQRIARIYRLGQHRPVQVINLVSANSFEEEMIGKLRFKTAMFVGVLDGGEDSIFVSDKSKFQQMMESISEVMGEEKTMSDEAPETIAPEDKEPEKVASAQPEAPSDQPPFEIASDTEMPRNHAESSSPQPVPETPRPHVPSTPKDLIAQGTSFLSGLAATLKSPQATEQLIDSLVDSDPATGQTTLKIPVPDKQTVRNLLDIVGKLFG